MNNMEIGNFIRGIKVYLEDSQTTQEEFAKGVTSKVNLSNVLRGNSGTSEKMRMALAKKTGMSIEELINLGKQGSKPDGESVVLPQTTRKALTQEDISSMSALGILEKITEIKDQWNAATTEYTKQLNFIIKAIIKDREELIEMLASQSAILNAIEEMVVEIDEDLKVIDCNRSATEKLGIYPNGEAPVTPEHVKQVFVSGRKNDTIFKEKKTRIYPIFNSKGTVKSVVLMVESDS